MTQQQPMSEEFMPPCSLPPLDLQPTAQSWHDFIIQSATMEAWQVSSMVLHALARETNARTLYKDAWLDYQGKPDGVALCTGLCHVLDELIQTFDTWQYVFSHLQARFSSHLQDDPMLQERLVASQQNCQRVSRSIQIIQHEIQEVANAYHILLHIHVWKQEVEKENDVDY